MTKILHVVGTRPNFVKMAPVIKRLRERAPSTTQTLVHTGQHYDRELSDIFVEELELPRPDHFLGVGSGSHAEQTARVLERMEAVLLEEQPDMVVVPGDVNSTLAAALAAVKLGIPIAHVEAGLRSFDLTMPEEVNRILVDQISHWCFTHSPEAEANLLREGVARERIHFVGNTMIDTLVQLRPQIEASDVHARLGVEPGCYVLVTLHRPTLVDGPLLERAIASLARLSHTYKVVFPCHPRTRKCAVGPADAPRLLLIDPIGYIDFLALELRAAAVLTDSGGVQEETTFLRVPCFTLRENTERPVTVICGTNRVLGLDVRRIEQIPEMLASVKLPLAPPTGWDGVAAERVAQVILPTLTEGSNAACAVSAAR